MKDNVHTNIIVLEPLQKTFVTSGIQIFYSEPKIESEMSRLEFSYVAPIKFHIHQIFILDQPREMIIRYIEMSNLRSSSTHCKPKFYNEKVCASIKIFLKAKKY